MNSRKFRTMLLVILLLPNVISCAGIEQTATVVGAAASSALVASKFCLFKGWCDDKVLYSADCVFASEHYFSDAAVDGMDESDLNWANAHNQAVKKFCKKESD